MSILYEDSATISTSEYSLTNDSTSLAAQTTAAFIQVFLDVNALADGDVFTVRIYEKVQSGGTQRVIQSFQIANDQGTDNDIWVQPLPLYLKNGWDVSIIKVAGTDRAIGWSIRDVSALVSSKVLTTQLTEAYAANGVAPTLAQSQFAIHQMLMQFAISGTSYTVKKLDNSTTAFVVTLDDATTPTSAVRT